MPQSKRIVKYAAIGVLAWMFSVAYTVLKGGDITIRRIVLVFILASTASVAAFAIETRRKIELDYFTSFLLFVACSFAVLIGILVGTSIIRQ